MKFSKIAFVLVTTVFFAVACSGGKGGAQKEHHSKDSKDAVVNGACDDETLAVGGSTTCSVEACGADCSIFLQDRRSGRQIWVGECGDEERVTIQAPAGIQASGELFCCAGDCDENKKVLSSSFSIKAGEADDQTPTAKGGDDIEPQHVQVSNAECSNDSDCISGKICQAGACVVAATPPPAPQAPQAPQTPQTPQPSTTSSDLKIEKFEAKSLADQGAGFVNVSWKVETGGRAIKEMYIYSRGWNQLKGEDCKVSIEQTVDQYNNIVTQFKPRSILLTENNKDLSIGSPQEQDVEKMILSAQKCVDGNKCHGFVPFSNPADEAKLPPTCRLDLIGKDGKFVVDSNVYTRVRALGLGYTIYVKLEDGSEASAESDKMTAPAPTIDGLQVKFSHDFYGVDDVSFHFENAADAPIVTGNCHQKGSPTAFTAISGSGEFHLNQCETDLKGSILHAATFSIEVPGVGSSAYENFYVWCEVQSVDLHELNSSTDYFDSKSGGQPLTSAKDRNNSGWVKLQGTATSVCYLQEGSKLTTLPGTYPWGIDQMTFGDTDFLHLPTTVKSDDFKLLPSGAAAHATARVIRSYFGNEFVVTARDFQGKTMHSEKVKGEKFKPEFKIVRADYLEGNKPPQDGGYGDWNQDGCWYGSWDDDGDIAEGDWGECVDSEGGHIGVTVHWEGKYLKHVKSTHCKLAGVAKKEGWLSQPDTAHPEHQEGKAKDNVYIFDVSGDSLSVTCDFEATSLDGKEILHWEGVMWSCGCHRSSSDDHRIMTKKYDVVPGISSQPTSAN